MRTSTLALLAFVVLMVIAALQGSTAGAASNELGGRPTNPDPNNARSSSIFIYSLDKGQTQADSVTLVNNSSEKQNITLYAVDAATSNTGALTCKQEVEAKNSVGGWITFSESSIELDAKSKKDIPFNVTVPISADIGEHNGCLVIQPVNDEGRTIDGNIRIRTRSAIRMAITVPGDLKRDVTIQDFRITQSNGIQEYLLKLNNTGNVSADVMTSVTLRTLFGGMVFEDGGDYPVIANKLLELRFSNDTRPFWGGWFFAGAEISYDKQAGVFGTTGAGGTIKKFADNNLIFISPHPIATIIYTCIVAAIIAAITILVRRQLRIRKWKVYTVKPKDTIESIAKSRNVTWRSIARINSIKAPYGLKTGETINVPERKNKD